MLICIFYIWASTFPCMSAFVAVIDSHLAHFDEMKLERLTAQFQLPIDGDDEDDVDDDDDKEDYDDAIDLMAAYKIDDDDNNKEEDNDGAIDLMAVYKIDDDEATLEMMSVDNDSLWCHSCFKAPPTQVLLPEHLGHCLSQQCRPYPQEAQNLRLALL